MNEQQFQTVVVDLARHYGWRVYHTYDSRRSQPGFPDLTMVRGGRLIFAELKTANGRLSTEQHEWLDRLAEAATVHIWRPSDMDMIRRVLAPEWAGVA